jgi:hypothetical protein
MTGHLRDELPCEVLVRSRLRDWSTPSSELELSLYRDVAAPMARPRSADLGFGGSLQDMSAFAVHS